MLSKISVWIRNVPYYAILIAGLVAQFGPMVAATLTGMQLAQWAVYVNEGIKVAALFIAAAKQYNPGTPVAVKVDKAIVAAQSAPPSPPGIASAMLGVLLMFAVPLGVARLVSGCASTNQALSNVEAAAPAVACVLGDIFSGVTDPAKIALDCDKIAAADILAIINAELQAEAKAFAVDSGPPPAAASRLAALHEAKDRAQAVAK